jgi:hypothetical protein
MARSEGERGGERASRGVVDWLVSRVWVTMCGNRGGREGTSCC